MDARDGVKAARALNPRTIIPIHYEGWKHFREGRTILEKSFATAGLSERVRWLELGQPTDVEI
jgi:L-ascorbate metabolism protein UlaG (beta-lactamase superfamily)